LTLGFWGKFNLFRTAIAGGYVWLAVLGLLTSLMSAFVAFRVLTADVTSARNAALPSTTGSTSVAAFCALCVVVLSFIPAELFQMAAQAHCSVYRLIGVTNPPEHCSGRLCFYCWTRVLASRMLWLVS
jgi:NADH-quinone oxidoreductase subunit N